VAKEFKVISVDDHVQEPPDLWTSRVSKEKWGDKIPHVARQSDGSEKWSIEGVVNGDMPLAEIGALASTRFAGQSPRTWVDVPKVLYNPEERLKAMDKDGVDVSVLYPIVAGRGGEVLASIEDRDLQLACVQAYNDWLLDVWGKASPRFVPQCLVPTSVQAAVNELERSVGKGHKGVIVPIEVSQVSKGATNTYSPEWDPFWAKAEALGVPVCFHSGSAPKILLDLYPGVDPTVLGAFDNIRRPITSSAVMGKFLFSGIPERFPKLSVIFGNSGVGWCSYALEVSDHEWDRKYRQITPVLRKDPPYEMELPSDMFHRQCYVTGSDESVGMRVREFIGVENILWQSEFPLDLSTYPNSLETIKKNLQGVPAEERLKIMSGTAAKLYKIQL